MNNQFKESPEVLKMMSDHLFGSLKVKQAKNRYQERFRRQRVRNSLMKPLQKLLNEARISVEYSWYEAFTGVALPFLERVKARTGLHHVEIEREEFHILVVLQWEADLQSATNFRLVIPEVPVETDFPS